MVGGSVPNFAGSMDGDGGGLDDSLDSESSRARLACAFGGSLPLG